MQAKQLAAVNGIALSVAMELAIEKFEDGTFGYYFVDHNAQTLFWPETVKSRKLLRGVRGVSEKSHISELSILFEIILIFSKSRVCAGGAILVCSPTCECFPGLHY